MATPFFPSSLPNPVGWDLQRLPSALTNGGDPDAILERNRVTRVRRSEINVTWQFTGPECKLFTEFGRETLLNWHRVFWCPVPEGNAYVYRQVEFVERPQIQLQGYNFMQVSATVRILSMELVRAANCLGTGFSYQPATADIGYPSSNGATFAGNGLGAFVGMGRISDNVNYIHTSPDGLNWSRNTLSGTADARTLKHVAGDTYIIPLGNAFQNTTTLRSTDGGMTWSNVLHNDGSLLYPYGVDIIPGGSVIRYTRWLSTATRVSFDQGASFSAGPAMPAAVQMRSMTYHAGKWYTIAMPTDTTVYVLDEASQLWSTWGKFTGVQLQALFSVGSALFAIEIDGTLHVSLDNAATFQPCTGTAVSVLKASRAGSLHYHPDGFWFAFSRATPSADVVVHGSPDGIDWDTMGEPINLPAFYPVGSALSGEFAIVGSVRDTTGALVRALC